MAYHYRKKIEEKKPKKNKLKTIFLIDGLLLCLLGMVFFTYKGNLLFTADEPTNAQAQETGEVQEPIPEESADKEETVEKEPEAVEPEPEPKDTKVSITVSAAGDCTLGNDVYFGYNGSVIEKYDTVQDPGYFFQNVLPVFSEDDLTIVNLEGTFTTSETRMDKQFAFKADPSYAKILTAGSVEAANLANNHSKDYGEQSYTDTIAAVDAENIANFGYDRTAVREVNGVKVGLFGVNVLTYGIESMDGMLASIQALKEEGAQIIIGSFHWGEEKAHYPGDTQKQLAHAAIDNGVDLVLGHHPHVLQGIEVYKGKNIVYSLGNFAFGGNFYPSDMDAMIFQQTFTLENDVLVEDNVNNIIPCKISSAWEQGYNNFQPIIVDGDVKDSIMNRINTYSEGLGAQ